MEALSEAHQILESMVTQLGFEVTIEKEESQEGACLQILTEESGLLIGKHGDRLDDLQYLVNRILQKKMEDPPRIRIDCDQDAVWVKAVPAGPTCHTGARSCFFRRVGADGLMAVDAAD